MDALNNIAFIGEKRYAVGNDLYFDYLNKMDKGIISTFILDTRKYNYYSALCKSAQIMNCV